jgi:hypothetical protein
MADLTSLIERIEAATEGSRELDALICIALDDRPSNAPSGKLISQRLGVVSVYPFGPSWDALPYASSFDATIRQLPSGHSYTCGDCNQDNLPWACVTRASDGKDFAATGADVTLALLAAILRARQTEAHS